MTTRKTLIGSALAATTLVLALAGCGGNTGSGQGASTPGGAATGRSDHDQADVDFAQQMIPHHSQAVEMAGLVAGRTGNAKVIDLAGRIRQAQEPEIRQMTGWLTAWGSQPAMPGMNLPGMTMPGMMGDADLGRLRAATGTQFDTMWLHLMTQHHQGAIDMSRTELAQGGNADAKALAQKIITAQQAEITEMKGMLTPG